MSVTAVTIRVQTKCVRAMNRASAKTTPNGLFGSLPRTGLSLIAGFGHRAGCTNRCDKCWFRPSEGVKTVIMVGKRPFRFTVLLQLV